LPFLPGESQVKASCKAEFQDERAEK